MNKEFLIWLAGFFDGEGCIFIRIRHGIKSKNYILGSSVSQKDRGILDYIKRFVKSGAISRNEHDKAWELEFSTKTTCKLLKQLLPYLKIKKLEAQLAIQFYENKMNCSGRGKSIPQNELAWRRIYYCTLKYIKKHREFINETKS